MPNHKKVRQSNMELLRIVAALMIIMFHIGLHCVKFQLTDEDSIQRMANGLFCQPEFYKKLFLVEGVMPFGQIANAVFILISGYFMVEKGGSINIGKISKKLLFQVGFAALALTGASTIYYFIRTPDLKFAVSMRSITDFNSMNWFAGYYFLVILIAGLFLNKRLEQYDQKKYTNFLLIVLGVVSLSWAGGTILEGLGSGLRTLICGVFLYALGGYVKRYDPFGRIRAWALIALVVALYALIYLSYYNSVQNSIQSYLIDAAVQEANGKKVDDFIQPIPGFTNFGIVPMTIAVVMLELFSRIRIPNSRIIGVLGSGTFMIYLLHDNDFWRYIWRESDWITVLYYDPLRYAVKLLLWTLVVFAVGMILYLIYLGLSRLLKKCRKLVLKSANKDRVKEEQA